MELKGIEPSISECKSDVFPLALQPRISCIQCNTMWPLCQLFYLAFGCPGRNRTYFKPQRNRTSDLRGVVCTRHQSNILVQHPGSLTQARRYHWNGFIRSVTRLLWCIIVNLQVGLEHEAILLSTLFRLLHVLLARCAALRIIARVALPI